MRDLFGLVLEALVDVTWLVWLLIGAALLAVIGLTALAITWTLTTVRGWMPTQVEEKESDWVPFDDGEE